jgi:hypothetical protein
LQTAPSRWNDAPQNAKFYNPERRRVKRRSLEQGRHASAAWCGVTASVGSRIAVLLAASACNSVLGIHEASLTCDDPGCASVPGPAAPAGADIAGADSVGGVPDGGAPPSSSPSGGAGGSGASGEGISVAPIAPPNAGSGGAAAGSGQPGASSGGSGVGGAAEPPNAGAGGAPPGAAGAQNPGQALCNAGDACADCLCDECEQPLAACSDTPGCLEIIACSRNSGCFGFECYCGSVDPVICATTDLADGPCIGIMLAAPGAHPPSVMEPNAGPASAAALAVANCSGQLCAAPCVN